MGQPQYTTDATSPLGVLLMNTGTPDEPTIEAIQHYLADFMSDPLLFTAPPFIWKRIVKHFILPNRPKKTIKNYRMLWTKEGFPFLNTTIAQGEALEKALNASGIPAKTAIAMRYGNPSIETGLAELREAGCQHIVLIPLYPQEVKACTGSCFFATSNAFASLEKTGWSPQVTEIRGFHAQPSYIHALAESVKNRWNPSKDGHLLLSFHSTLIEHIAEGDRYPDFCEQTRLLLAKELDMPEEHCSVSYHSRFDSRKWLQPFSNQTVSEWADQGIRDLCVICPGFVTECIETAIDIDRELRATFLEHAQPGNTYTYIPCLNDDPLLIDALLCEIQDALRRIRV